VGNVVQHQTAHRHRSQIHDRGRLLDMRQARVVGVERERNEDLKSARFILQFPQPDQVVDAVVIPFYVPVKHRAVGTHPA